MNEIDTLNLEEEIVEDETPVVIDEEQKIKEKIIKQVKKRNTKKRSITAENTRDRLMRMGRLSHSAKVLHSYGLCGGCRLPKKYCRCGPKFAMDEEALSKYESAFKCGMNVAEACAHVGISQKTYYQFERSHPEWRELRHEWQTEPEREARQKIVNDIKVNVDTAKWYAERKLRSEFGKSDGENRPPEIKINLIGMYGEDGSMETISASAIEEEPPLIASAQENYEEQPTTEPQS